MVIISVIFLILVICIIIAYNKGVILRNYVREAFSTMDVYLKMRWDLVPNLIEVVKGYAQHEKNIFGNITALRAKGYSDLTDSEKIRVNKQLGMELSKIIAVAENYPDLKASANFSQLMEQLNSIENQIADSRRYYNGTVREYNTYIELFPTNIVALMFNFKRAQMFEIDSSQRENVGVQF